ncbi:uncharacterized protein Z520_04376 [Fonsecaea multimorphosa CBS 102226]|uniref:F-box domain-containing protein n=1 Tax=Fonsecaea multimorphosa CBS 102226 TaxID=1442371 RepID=A0A0D2HCX4_9EURO|nr:uncharacterized protein Z520_04376 [Fonsecaea multimorphosa CBS 102226]KIX99740.1 hypothetical protein Z520_04376 [Fonsecaea multimorphosa CBS 102226]OAL26788.1 hypothetical protein AYO22_04141 [Fonsecaea multimorphosa]
MDKADQSVVMDPSAAEPENHRLKQLTDLPNEILSLICSFLIPHCPDITPFKADELDATRTPTRLEGLETFNKLYAGYIFTEQFTETNPTEMKVGGCDRPDFPVLKASTTKKRGHNSLASFAATCRYFNTLVRRLCARRHFTLTVSAYGLTFENLRDASPMQTFYALHPVISTWHEYDFLMVVSEGSQVVEIPPMQLPGNIAFGAFTDAFRHLRHLHLHVEMEMARLGIGKTDLFLERIGQLHRLRRLRGAKQLSLERLDIVVNVGFHNFALNRAIGDHDDSEIPNLTGSEIMFLLEPEELFTVGRYGVWQVGAVMAGFANHIWRFRAEENYRRMASGTSRVGVQSPVTTRLLILGQGTPNMRWGQTGRFHTSEGWEVVPFGSFEDFCKKLQDHMFPPAECCHPAENRIIDQERYICELGLPLDEDYRLPYFDLEMDV